MDEKKRVYDAEVMALPPLRLVIGDVPNPDPDRRNRSNQLMGKTNREVECTVKRLIAHLEDK
ncbi:MAG TPA: hypothetical protein VMT91_02025 [Anaerolineales bacterium]|nr:hypothetical protein [Anaerolineales bacterium]